MGILVAKGSAVTVALMAAAAMVAMMAANAEAQQSLNCASNLTFCANYLNSTNPPKDCCDPLRNVVTHDLSCLCAIYKDPNILKAFGIDVNQALKLPFNCGITTSSKNLCNSTAVGSPSGSPAPPGAPPATPGNGSNGANGLTRVSLSGLAGLFLIWLAILA